MSGCLDALGQGHDWTLTEQAGDWGMDGIRSYAQDREEGAVLGKET